jgi:hypothetical protein
MIAADRLASRPTLGRRTLTQDMIETARQAVAVVLDQLRALNSLQRHGPAAQMPFWPDGLIRRYSENDSFVAGIKAGFLNFRFCCG